MGAIELKAVEKWFGEVQVIKGVDLTINDGEFAIFAGPSGCGKSTLLRMIAGLEETSRGEILIDGRVATAEPLSKRGLAMVFQSYALYPHMSVAENMGFSLKTGVASKAEQQEKVAEAARALRLKATMVYVTHDQVEAMTLADRIVVLSAGRIEQVGSPKTLYDHPDNLFVAQFIGSPKMNVIALPCADLRGGRAVDRAHRWRKRPAPRRCRRAELCARQTALL